MLNEYRMRKYAMSPFLSKVSEEQEARKQVRDLTAWIAQMILVITELTNCLDSTIGTWENFKRRDIHYFRHRCESPPRSIYLDSFYDEIDRVFDELKNFRTEFEKIKMELSGSFSNTVRTILPIINFKLALFLSIKGLI